MSATYLTPEIKSYIGLETEPVSAFDPVERGAVRRFAQAIMDCDPVFMGDGVHVDRYGGAVAPPLFPLTQHRVSYYEPDYVAAKGQSPDFDGTRSEMSSVAAVTKDEKFYVLPQLPLGPLALLNGGSEIEMYRYLNHGEKLFSKSRYASITERQTSKGLMVFVVIDVDYLDADGKLVARVKRTTIRR